MSKAGAGPAPPPSGQSPVPSQATDDFQLSKEDWLLQLPSKLVQELPKFVKDALDGECVVGVVCAGACACVVVFGITSARSSLDSVP